MDEVDITAVINLHREGLLAHASLLSIAQAKIRAESAGIGVEMVAVLDDPDEITKAVVQNCDLGSLRTIEVHEGDLGAARNRGVHEAKGHWVAFLDADDLWGENWLVAAYAAATRDPREIVWHPEVNLYFGLNLHLFRHIDMEDPSFEALSLLLDNYWTSLCFARRALFLEIPYRKTSLTDQIGYEDWAWNMETIGAGLLHKIVSGTAHAIRVKPHSLLEQTRGAVALPHSSELFRKNVIRARRRSPK